MSESASICNNCRNRLTPWAESLRKDYDGCNLLLQEVHENKTAETLANHIDSEEIGTGWVSNGVSAFNNQILTKNTTDCDFACPK